MKAIGYVCGQRVVLDLSYVGDDAKGRQAFLAAAAALDFSRLVSAARADGVELVINSARRTHEDQLRRWQWYEAKKERWDRSDQATRGDPPLRPARPGWSGHESGTSIDLNPEPWLREHAHEYGFTNDVPREPWHFSHKPEV